MLFLHYYATFLSNPSTVRIVSISRMRIIKQDKLYLISGNGSQPTSKRYMEACSVLEIKQIFTSYSNPKGNADTEQVIRTLKEDFVWTREFSSPFEFAENFKERVEDYNNHYPYSSLNYSNPSEYEKEHLLVTNNFNLA